MRYVMLETFGQLPLHAVVKSSHAVCSSWLLAYMHVCSNAVARTAEFNNKKDAYAGANTFEGPFAILRAAKKRKVVSFEGELLLSPTHDAFDMLLWKDSL